MSIKLTLNDTTSELRLVARRPHLVCTIDGAAHAATEGAVAADGSTHLTIDGRRYQVWRSVERDRVHVRLGGQTFSVAYEDAVTAAAHEAGGADEIHADMPGVTVAVHCERGAAVAAGDALLTIESMKMQMTITAPRDGMVGQIHAAANASFDKGALLVSLEPQPE